MGENPWSYVRHFYSPQEEHFSPLLFSIFVNIANRLLLHANHLVFTDDTKLLFRVNALNDCLKLQSDLNRLTSWAYKLALLF